MYTNCTQPSLIWMLRGLSQSGLPDQLTCILFVRQSSNSISSTIKSIFNFIQLGQLFLTSQMDGFVAIKNNLDHKRRMQTHVCCISQPVYLTQGLNLGWQCLGQDENCTFLSLSHNIEHMLKIILVQLIIRNKNHYARFVIFCSWRECTHTVKNTFIF